MIDELDRFDRPDRFDDSVRGALGDLVAAAPEPTTDPFATITTAAGEAPSRRGPAIAAAVVLAAAASVALVIAVRDDSAPEPAGVADANTTVAGTVALPGSTAAPVETGTPWLVEVDPGTVIFNGIENDVTAGLTRVDGPARGQLRCAEWTLGDDQVLCTAVSGQGYLPAIIYTLDDDGQHYVEVSTLHSDIGIHEYARRFSQGKDVGYEDEPLTVEDVMVGRWPGALVEAPNGVRRVTVEPIPGVLSAVETGSAYSREDLLDIAADLQPVNRTARAWDFPIVLAESVAGDGTVVTALGGVIDGELCLRTPDRGCVTLDGGTLHVEGVGPGQAGAVGLAAADVAAVEYTSLEGARAVQSLGPIVAGTTKAFALPALDPVSADPVVALDAAGSPLGSAPVVTLDLDIVAVDTTVGVPGDTSSRVVAFDGLLVGDDVVGFEIIDIPPGFCTVRRSNGDRGCDGLPASTSPAYVLTAGWDERSDQQLVYGLVDDGLTPWLETADGRQPIPTTDPIDVRRAFATQHPYGEPATVIVTDASGAQVFAYDVGE